MKKISLILLLIIVAQYSYCQVYRVGDLRFRIFNEDSIRNSLASGLNSKVWDLDVYNVLSVEGILRKNFQIKQKEGIIQKHRMLGDYDRQYIGLINKNSHKIIWLNCFLFNRDLEGSEYPNYLIDVNDGGDIYFEVQIDIETGECISFDVNGYE